MDIICAKCGKHFSSIEAAREHSGHCKETSEGEAIRWIPAPKSKITPEEWGNLMKLINPQGVPSTATPSNLEDSPASSEKRNRFPRKKEAVKNKRKKNRYGTGGLGNLHKKGEYSNDTATTKNDTRVVLVIFIVVGVFAVVATWYKYLASFSILWLVISLLLSIIFIPASTLWALELVKQMIHHQKSKNIPAKKETVKNERERKSNYKIQNWLIAILLIFAFCIIGLGISIFIGNFIPLWLMLGFSLIFSIEKWFNYYTKRHKVLGKLYRLLLNLSTLSLLGLIVWSGMKLFSQQFVQNQLIGSLIFLAELVSFGWLWRIVSRNSWRWPSMKLTVFSLICLFVVFAFAGVKPFTDYKTSLVTRYTAWTENMERSKLEKEAATKAQEQQKIQEAIAMMPIPVKEAPTKSQTASGLTTTQALKMEEAEQEAFRLINAIREEAGIPATKWDDELYKLSKQHTQDMSDRGELFHTPVGSSHGENAWGGTGYYHYRYDELAKVIVGSWMSSPLHEAWLLHAPIKESVVSIVVTPAGQYASWSFWMNTLDRGPELIERIVREWKSSGSNLPWIEWLQMRGYLKP